MTRSAIILALLLAGGCALPGRDAARVLEDADARAARGDYPAALAAYDAYLARYPDDDGATRARAVRKLVGELVAMRTELAALQERVSGREAEVTRLRQEIRVRQAEVTRFRQDLEELKRTDLMMERRRR